MKIQITNEIIEDFEQIGHDPISSEYFAKKWVAVDELIEWMRENKQRFRTSGAAILRERPKRYIIYEELLKELEETKDED